ncbi:MAG TPA: HIT domain-containing protein [Armatimonadota bacterium]|jgi:ATP adenylyltransferase
MAYIGGKAPEGCVFCVKPAEEDDDRNHILYRGESCFVILNAFPYNSGHLMVIPYRHLSDLCDLSDAERQEMMQLSGRATAGMTRILGAEGYNVGMNLGRIAGAGIADHLHLHVVPRWNGDTNFMPVLADIKVLPEALEDTYRRLKAIFHD